MTHSNKFGPAVDYAEVERIRVAAEVARGEAMGRWIGAASRGIVDAFRTLDRWFEGARALQSMNDSAHVRARADYPAVFGGNPDRVGAKPANDDKHVAAA
jgi:hypothetical protein